MQLVWIFQHGTSCVNGRHCLCSCSLLRKVPGVLLRGVVLQEICQETQGLLRDSGRPAGHGLNVVCSLSVAKKDEEEGGRQSERMRKTEHYNRLRETEWISASATSLCSPDFRNYHTIMPQTVSGQGHRFTAARPQCR